MSNLFAAYYHHHGIYDLGILVLVLVVIIIIIIIIITIITINGNTSTAINGYKRL